MSLQDEIASIAGVVTGFLLDQATNSRTGAVTPCDVTAVPTTIYLRLSGSTELAHIARWQLTLPDATDIVVGDILTVTNPVTGVTRGKYLVLLLESSNTMSISTDCFAIALPTPVTANIKRNGSYLFSGSMVNLWPFTGALMRPISSAFMQDQFNSDITQGFVVYLQWPTGVSATANNVIQGGDVLAVGTKSYPIVGVRAFPPSYIELYVQVQKDAV